MKNAALELILQDEINQHMCSTRTENIRKHAVVLLLANLRDRLLQHLAYCIDHDVDMSKVTQGVLEELGDSSSGDEVALVDGQLDTRVLLAEFGLQRLGLLLATGRVVVERQGGALGSQFTGSLGTQVLDTSGDECDFVCEGHSACVFRSGVVGYGAVGNVASQRLTKSKMKEIKERDRPL